ncbi:MAG: GTP-binding protein, partial [Pseudomonadota bacterium]
MTIPLTILGGYLGAGKTTLLNQLLAEPEGERLALIINDFGAINIDAALIESEAGDQINLTNGCVCCGMSTGFDEALAELLERDPLPDRIVVEASGVADVVSLAQYGYHGGLSLDGIVVLADAETVRAKARDKYVAETVKRQLRGADLIVLNKADLIDAERCATVHGWLRELAPSVPVLTTSQAQVPRAVLFDLT